MAERQNSIRISSWAAQQVERRGAMGNTSPSQAVVCGRAWCGTELILPIQMVVLVWYITSLTPMVHGQERVEQMQVLHTVHLAVWGAVPSVYHQSRVSAFYLTVHFVTGTEPILNLCAAPSVRHQEPILVQILSTLDPKAEHCTEFNEFSTRI